MAIVLGCTMAWNRACIKQQRFAAFALIELLVIIVILAILASIAIPQYQSQSVHVTPIESFPWPPPAPSEFTVVPRALVAPTAANITTLGSFNTRLLAALDAAGYAERSYFSVPGGFALVTRLEQFTADGTPSPGADRWITDVAPLRKFSLAQYLSYLITAKPGHFRVLVFVVTDATFAPNGAKIDRDQALQLLHNGTNKLPQELAAVPYSQSTECTALIYEFTKTRADQAAEFVAAGGLSAMDHLTKSNLVEAMRR